MKKGTFRFNIEERTLQAMIKIYCRKQHGHVSGLCPDCTRLQDYALNKLERCTFGAKKPNCIYCPIHCYEPSMREQVQKVMRFSGPLMLKHYPLLALVHIARRLRKKPVMNKRPQARKD